MLGNREPKIFLRMGDSFSRLLHYDSNVGNSTYLWRLFRAGAN